MPKLFPDPPGELVFVYGTYRRWASNKERMKGAVFVSRAMVRGRLLKVGGLPALVVDPQAETWVRGDVFRAAGPQLEAFHEYEGLAGDAVEGKDFRIAEGRVHFNPRNPHSKWGLDVKLWKWIGPVTEAEEVPSGDWLDVECPASPPLFTAIMCACAGGMPVGLMAAYALRMGGMGGVPLVMAMAAPVPGTIAFHFARRRRESLEGLCVIVSVVLLLEAFIAVIAMGVVVKAYIRHWL